MRSRPAIVPPALVLAIALAACDSAPEDALDTGGSSALTIEVSTTGTPAGSAMFYVKVGDETSRAIASDGKLTREDLPPGTYRILLAGISPNCAVQGQNPLTISLRSGETAAATFTVSCRPGAIVRVTTMVTGEDLDPDGYRLKIGSNSWIIPAQGITILRVYTEGQTALELSGVAANCTPDSRNPTAITLVADETAPVTFRLACASTKGTIKVTASVGGVDRQSMQGLSVGLDSTFGGGAYSVRSQLDSSGSAAFSGVRAGPHNASLLGLQSNCRSDGPSIQALQVNGGDTTKVHFQVICSALPSVGALVTTTGVDLDWQGYTLKLGRALGGRFFAAYSFPVPANGRTAGVHVIPRTYAIRVFDLAVNCRVTSSPELITVGQADTTIAIAVVCNPRS